MELYIEFEKRIINLEKRYVVKDWRLPHNLHVDRIYIDEGGMVESSVGKSGGLRDDIIVINNKTFLTKYTHISEKKFEQIEVLLKKTKKLYKMFEIRAKRKEKISYYTKDAIEKEEEKLKQNWNGSAKI